MRSRGEDMTSNIDDEVGGTSSSSPLSLLLRRRTRPPGGCIKSSKGPWVVRRTTSNGGTVTKYRYPSERERLNNQQRERNRRAVAHNIFDGLRAHGNYSLPKNPDSNDLLRALCEEAGWHVEEDGTVYRKTSVPPSLMNMDSSAVGNGVPPQPQAEEAATGYCTCEDPAIDSFFAAAAKCGQQKNLVPLDLCEGLHTNLALSISLPFASQNSIHFQG